MKFFLIISILRFLTAEAAFGIPPASTLSTSRLSLSTTAVEPENAATLRSMTFCNLEKSQEPQLLCDFLMEIGACSTSIRDSDRDTDREVPIFSEPGDDPWEDLAADNAAVVCGDQAVGRNVWKRCDVSAHFAASADLKLVAELVEETLDISLNYEINQVPDRDWVVHVQQSWNPILVEGIVLRFPWHTDEDVAKIVGDNGKDMVELQLEGGIAFGTGEHPTTQLCLRWVQDVLREQEVSSLMDYGAGSGVLGMAACALNPSVKSIGVDIDVDAVRIANANAEVNGLNMENYLPPLEETVDSESKSVLMKAYAQNNQQEGLPVELNGPVHDALVANILAGPLITLAPTLAGLIKPGGGLGLSGILTPQADRVVEAYIEYFDNVKVEKKLGGWVLITGNRKTD
jgi:ribosomal protein L11 methyltransferase